MLTNLANFDPIGKFMEQITGKCVPSAKKKQGGDKCVWKGNPNFCDGGTGLDGGGGLPLDSPDVRPASLR